MVARRVQSYHVDVATELAFAPDTFQQMAGLVFYYNTGHYHYLHITGDDTGQHKYLSIASSDNFELTVLETPVEIRGAEKVKLRAVLSREELQFYYSLGDSAYHPVGGVLDASILSDDHVREGSARYRAAFTGCFVGLCCQDLAYNQMPADFFWFEYRELDK